MLDTLTMPPAGGLDESDEQKRARLLTSNVMPPAGTPAPSNAQPSTNVMPPAGQPSQPQPNANASALAMPPAMIASPLQRIYGAAAHTPEPGSVQPEGARPGDAKLIAPAPVEPMAQKQYPAIPATPPELHGWKKALDAVGSVFPIGRAIESAIPGTPQNWEMEQGKQAARDKAQAEIGKDTATAGAEASRGRLTDEQAKQLGNMVPVTLPNGQTIYLNEKDATAIMGKQVQGANAEKVQGQKDDTVVKVTGMKDDTAGGIQDKKDKSSEQIASERNQNAKDIEKMRTESAQNIARAHDLTSKEVARIRGDLASNPNALTSTMKTMKQQAQATLPSIDRAMDETEKVAALLGPGEGRWNQFIQGKLGISDPKYAHYADEIHMVSTAVTLAHARGRMSNELFESFQKMFDAGAQSSENMMQALNVAKEWLTEYANMGEPGSPVGTPTATPANPATPAAPAAKGAIKTAGDWKKERDAKAK